MHEKAKLSCTRNYNLFRIGEDNRDIETNRRKKLRQSMQQYGWLPAYPMHCVRVNGTLEIRDGQHRFRIAQELAIPVWFVVSNDEADIAVINDAQKPWNIADYAKRYAKNGNPEYQQLLDFAQDHRLATSIAAGLLFGHVHGSNVAEEFKAGRFKVRDAKYAATCARIYAAIRDAAPESANRNAMAAISAIARVPSFQPDRMIQAIGRRADLLKRYGSRDAYLEAFEKIYNNQARRHRVGLKFLAQEAMADRQVARPK